MAKQTYAQLQAQITSLILQAQQVRQQETSEVVARIKEAIEAYGIQPADLFGKRGAPVAKSSVVPSKSKLKSKSKASHTTAKFTNGQGGEWVGRGPRPKWLRDALSQGRSLAEFAVGQVKPATNGAAATAVASKKLVMRNIKEGTSKRTAAAKKTGFSDGAGKQWSGRGPRPKWLKEALADGRSIDEFRV